MSKTLVTAVIVGAGHRSMLYAGYAKDCPDKFKITGVVEPNVERRAEAAKVFGIPAENCFASVEELVAGPRIGDAAINGTMDRLHVPTSIPLMEAGYHILLEKPFALNPEEARELVSVARRTERKVMVCHVLRYAPFYASIWERVAAGEIGEVMSVQMVENVSYHHMATSYIRGKWSNREQAGSPMLMAKCSHDLDLMMWFKRGVVPVRVSSAGSLMQFRPEKAPEGAGTRCLVDCPIEEECFYSAKKMYIDAPERWSFYVWPDLPGGGKAPLEEKIEALKTTNPFGRCVWRSDNNVVDHQTVGVEFADGSTGTLNMTGGTARPSRNILLLGSHGEIEGRFEESRFTIRKPDPRPGKDFSEEVVDLQLTGAMDGSTGGHGGGDMRLVADFVAMVSGEEPSFSCTSLEDSIYGHAVGFAADEAMLEKRVASVGEFDWAQSGRE